MLKKIDSSTSFLPHDNHITHLTKYSQSKYIFYYIEIEHTFRLLKFSMKITSLQCDFLLILKGHGTLEIIRPRVRSLLAGCLTRLTGNGIHASINVATQ